MLQIMLPLKKIIYYHGILIPGVLTPFMVSHLCKAWKHFIANIARVCYTLVDESDTYNQIKLMCHRMVKVRSFEKKRLLQASHTCTITLFVILEK